MIRRPPRSSLPDTLFPDTTLFRSRPSRWEETDGQPYQTAPAHQGGRSGDFLLSFSFPLTHRIVMPIMAEHRWLYPIDWPELSRAIRFGRANGRSEEHTSELQSLMRISYAVFCLKKQKDTIINQTYTNSTWKLIDTQTTNR